LARNWTKSKTLSIQLEIIMQNALTGIWHGLYSYPRHLEPVYFVATLVSHGQGFGGSIHEAVDGHSGAPLQLFASVEGTSDGTTVSFTKRYHGNIDGYHTVSYQGFLSADGLEIDGEWSIGGDWTGRFLMIRNPGATESVIRREYEKA
jgi:hypothetical protein